MTTLPLEGDGVDLISVDDVSYSAMQDRIRSWERKDGAAVLHHYLSSVPEGANIGFMQILHAGHIKLRVFERAVGETMACGSGACAAAAIGQLQGKLGKDVRVDLPGGSLRVRWQGPGSVLKMTGPAQHIYDGQLIL